MSLNIRKLRPELAAKAIAELNEVPERVESDVEHIKEWLKKQPHIFARTDEQWLMVFLRGCKFSLERVKEKLDTFYSAREFVPEFFKDRDPFMPEIQSILSAGFAVPMPKLNEQNGARPIFIRFNTVDFNQTDFVELLKTVIMMWDIVLLEDNDAMVSGMVAIWDYEGAVLAHCKLSPPIVYRAINYCQEACPARVKAIHFINVPPFFDIFFRMVKMVANKKLSRRLFVYTKENMDKFYEVVDRKILPTEYCGESGPIADIVDKMKKKTESYADYFKEDDNYRTVEKLRPENSRKLADIFGVEGSFRKLTID